MRRSSFDLNIKNKYTKVNVEIALQTKLKREWPIALAFKFSFALIILKEMINIILNTEKSRFEKDFEFESLQS